MPDMLTKVLTPRLLSQLAAEIYAHAGKLSFHQKLVSVYRPHYGPFVEILNFIKPESFVLDIGCGTGCFLLLASQLRNLSDGIGIDQNSKSISLAQKVNQNPKLQFLRINQIPENFYSKADIITFIDVFHHIPSQDKTLILETVCKNMRSGSRLIIKDLDPKPWWKALANRITDYVSTRSRVNYISQDNLTNLLQNNGYKIEESIRLDKHVWSHYLVVADKI